MISLIKRNNMRHVLRLLLALIPFYVFVWWMLGPVSKRLYGAEPLNGILMLVAGVVVLGVLEGYIFKTWLLPIWARAMSERLYAGSYLPDDDPLVVLSTRIITEHRHDLVPELERLVMADRRRVRAWLELARVLEDELKDNSHAARQLLCGAEAVRSKEDAAFLMWRAAMIYKKNESSRAGAREVCSSIVQRYPRTQYARLAEDFLERS